MTRQAARASGGNHAGTVPSPRRAGCGREPSHQEDRYTCLGTDSRLHSQRDWSLASSDGGHAAPGRPAMSRYRDVAARDSTLQLGRRLLDLATGSAFHGPAPARVPMPKVAVASTLFALALFGAWYWSNAAGEMTPPVAPPPAEATLPKALAAEAGDAAAEPANAATPNTDPAVRHAVTGVATAPADLSTVRVRVVDAATTAVMPGVEVLWYDATFDWSKLAAADRDLQQQDLEELLRRSATRVHSDADGRVVIRPQSRWATLIARHGDLYGAATWYANQPPPTSGPFPGELVLRLQLDRTLLARTVDGDGRPVAGVTVQFACNHRRPDGSDQTSVRNLPPTGLDGITRLRHVQESFLAGHAVNNASLCARLTGGDSAPVAIDPNALPATPVDVVLPAFGSVLVALLGPDGTPWVLPAHHGLDVLLFLPSWSGNLARGVTNVRCDDQGQAHFAHVRCNVRLNLSGPLGWPRNVAIDGPRRAGEQVRAELRLPANCSFVAGRVLTEDGAVFTGSVQVEFESDRGSASSGLPLDADGRFLEPVPDSVGRVVTIAVREQGSGDTNREATVALHRPLAPGRNDLGDLVLSLPPLLVAGQVIAIGGHPAMLSSLSVELECRPPGEHQGWFREGRRFQLDAQQRFEVRGRPRDRQFRLVVLGDCAPHVPREFKPGTTDLRVEVTAGGWVAATFLVDPLWQDLCYRLLAPANTIAVGPWHQQHREEGQPFQDGDRIKVAWHGLAAGTHRLLVGCRGLGPMLDLAIAVPAGAAADDVRLHDIDLRGRLRAIVVRVTDATGKPFPGRATLALRGSPAADAAWHGISCAGATGDGERLVLDRPTDLWVAADGLRGATIAGVFADTTVALARAPSVTLRLADAPALPAAVTANLSWRALDWPARGPRLEVTRGPNRQSGDAAQLLGVQRLPRHLAGGRATVVLDVPFAVAVHLVLSRPGKPPVPLPDQTTVLDPAQVIDGQTLDLRVEPTAVQAAVDQLMGK